MKRYCAIGACAALGLLAACAGPPPGPRQTADIPIPDQHPRGIISSFPPADPSFSPLRCLTYGPNTECTRDNN